MITFVNGNALNIPLADNSVQCAVTSPPYWGLRDYGVSNQIGLEASPALYVTSIVAVMREVWRVLKDDGVLWLNLGDSYATGTTAGRPLKGTRGFGENTMKAQNEVNRNGRPFGLDAKQLCMIPARVALELQADGWYLRSEIIWAKPNPMPESVTDRPTRSHEMIYLLTKQARYYYDADAVSEKSIWAEKDKRFTNGPSYGGKTLEGNYSMQSAGAYKKDGMRNLRDVWTISTNGYAVAHFATFPPKLIEPCILAGSRKGDVVLDPFAGSGTVGQVCAKHGRQFIGVELNPKYIELAHDRTSGVQVVLV